jgi:uncharacterized protein YyaL (SSP411 family)
MELAPANDQSVIVRLKEGEKTGNSRPISFELIVLVDHDGAEPSSNSVAAMNLLRLSSFFLDEPTWKERAVKLLKVFYEPMMQYPTTMPELLVSVMAYHIELRQVHIYGDMNDGKIHEFLRAVHGSFHPYADIIIHPPTSDGIISAHVCRGEQCSMSVSSPEALQELLSSPYHP